MEYLVMRPTYYYAVFVDGQITTIVRSAKAAKLLSHAYRGFRSRLEAEEFACWWNYEHPRWTPTKSIRETYLKSTTEYIRA
jgi:hypothetical protein